MIRRSLQRIGTELVTATPKTRSSIRALQIASTAAKALVAHASLRSRRRGRLVTGGRVHGPSLHPPRER